MNLLLNNKIKIAFLLLLVIISFYRSPYIFLEGRFMGEEGSHYFKNAYENNFLHHLLYFVKTAGYYNLITNLLTELSTYVPLIYAPLVTVYGSLIVTLTPVFLILFKDSYLFKNDNEKIIGSLIFFITYPHVSEVWANSVNSQIYLFFVSLLILYLKSSGKKNQILSPVLLLLSGLSGIYSCILTPLYFVKYHYTKARRDLINTNILIVCSLIQLALIFYSRSTDQLYKTSEISSLFNLDKIINLFYNFFAKPILGRQPIYFVYENFGFGFFGYISMLYLFSAISVIVMFILIKFKFVNFFLKDHVLQSLILIYILVFTVVIFGADNLQTSGRYATIPGVLFLLIIFYLAANFPVRAISNFFSILILISIVVGFYEFRPSTINVKHQYIKFLDCVNCPQWKTEVENWKKNQNYQISIWPYPKKRLELNKSK